jgi:hypothetical protein
VAAVSGDARRALNICRRAAEMSQLAGSQRVGRLELSFQTATCPDPLLTPDWSRPHFQVTIKHVNEALTEMSASPMIKAMQTAAHHEQLFLLAVVSCFRSACLAPRSPCVASGQRFNPALLWSSLYSLERGIEEVALEDLIGEHRRICETRGEAVPSASAVAQVCAGGVANGGSLSSNSILASGFAISTDFRHSHLSCR